MARSIPMGQVLGGVARVALMPVVFLVPAGRLWWPEAWALCGLYVAFAVVVVVVLAREDPDLLRERMKASPVQRGQAGWDAVLMVGMGVTGLALLVLPGLDAVRFGWSEVPLWVELVGFALHPPLLAWTVWVMRTNSWLARVVKIDEERGHQVVTTGPYAVVRHPMYAGVLPLLVAMPLALGSWWSLIPAGAMGALLVVRTALEDRMLHDALDGYPEYAAKTRYRLVPGIW